MREEKLPSIMFLMFSEENFESCWNVRFLVGGTWTWKWEEQWWDISEWHFSWVLAGWSFWKEHRNIKFQRLSN